MSNYSGYMGKVAVLDLCTQETKAFPWSDEDRQLYIGGKAMAAKLMSDCLPESADALSEENVIVIATGPLTGTGAPCSSHFVLASRSPLTGGVTYSECGGNFGLYLKKAGYDGLIIKGKCEKPSWIEIRNDKFFFHKAGSVWGMKTDAAQTALKANIDSIRNCNVKCGMLVIGPAGENLVRYANVVSGIRQAENCDLGAVFGAKLLKGIVATGNKDIPVADAEGAREDNKKLTAMLKAHPLTGTLLPKQGTAGFVSYLDKQGLLPVKNYSAGSAAYCEKLSGETFEDKYNAGNTGCMYCPVKCERSVLLDEKTVKGPELDAMILLGSNIDNDNPELIIKWNYELHELGIDLARCANTLAWAMNANEKGLWDNELVFGRTNNISETLADIAYRKNTGAELAEGSAVLSEKYGGKEYAYSTESLHLFAANHMAGLDVNRAGEYCPRSFKAFVAALQEAMISAGQCKIASFTYIPAFMVKKPDGIAAKLARRAMPAAAQLAVLADGIGCARQLEYAVGMPMKLKEYVASGKLGCQTEAELNAKLGAKENGAVISEALAAYHKTATAFTVKKAVADAKAMYEKLTDPEGETVARLKKLLGKDED